VPQEPFFREVTAAPVILDSLHMAPQPSPPRAFAQRTASWKTQRATAKPWPLCN